MTKIVEQVAAYMEIQSKLDSIAKQYIEVFEDRGTSCYDDNARIQDDHLVTFTMSYTVFGDFCQDYLSFPVSYLWSEDWMSDEKKRRKNEKAKCEKARKELEARKIREREKEERVLYRRLKKKYEVEE